MGCTGASSLQSEAKLRGVQNRTGQKVAMAQRHFQRHHVRFAQRIDRWIGHLRKTLLAVIPKRAGESPKETRAARRRPCSSRLLCQQGAGGTESYIDRRTSPPRRRRASGEELSGALAESSNRKTLERVRVLRGISAVTLFKRSRQRSNEPAWGVASRISPGPRRCRSAMRDSSRSSKPVSDPAMTNPSWVTVYRIGRRPLRSNFTPTESPSLNTSAAGPSHGSPSRRKRFQRRAHIRGKKRIL